MSPLRALTERRAATDSTASDRALRGRTYAIPFAHVWTAALGLAGGGLRGWSVAEADDREGVIVAEVRTRVFGFVGDVRIEITLDPDAQTRVDLVSESRTGRADLGANRRRVRFFCRALDRALGAGPRTILNPSARPGRAR